ncbi:hypothetical protein E2C01_023329 [Portunus trituberculatus]|uniref:Uncharacterized protein n=1 Tax=Portunus trituberculatus TaxID=210409 RepID=A0A5B7EBA9_PORTR|nr:hypothetical protein [Portunus trituberculatus]
MVMVMVVVVVVVVVVKISQYPLALVIVVLVPDCLPHTSRLDPGAGDRAICAAEGPDALLHTHTHPADGKILVYCHPFLFSLCPNSPDHSSPPSLCPKISTPFSQVKQPSITAPWRPHSISHKQAPYPTSPESGLSLSLLPAAHAGDLAVHILAADRSVAPGAGDPAGDGLALLSGRDNFDAASAGH